jgi:hypothetical protein
MCISRVYVGSGGSLLGQNFGVNDRNNAVRWSWTEVFASLRHQACILLSHTVGFMIHVSQLEAFLNVGSKRSSLRRHTILLRCSPGHSANLLSLLSVRLCSSTIFRENTAEAPKHMAKVDCTCYFISGHHLRLVPACLCMYLNLISCFPSFSASSTKPLESCRKHAEDFPDLRRLPP